MKSQSKPNVSALEVDAENKISFAYLMSIAAKHSDLTIGQVYAKILDERGSAGLKPNKLKR